METAGLKLLARELPSMAESWVKWMGEYRNPDLVAEVFDSCDAIVVPSIWAENSPLVIHEALQAGVPVITTGYGGRAEYVRHEENGLLFAHHDAESLARQMQRLAEDPRLAGRLGARGYLQSPDGNVPDMREHSLAVGEPLLYLHFDEILDLCAEYGVRINLTTNGIFPRRGAGRSGSCWWPPMSRCPGTAPPGRPRRR